MRGLGVRWVATSAPWWPLSHLSSSEVHALILASQIFLSFLSGPSTWLRGFLSILSPDPLLPFLVLPSSDVNFLRFLPPCLKMPVSLSEEDVLSIRAKSSLVLSSLSAPMLSTSLLSHLVGKPKQAPCPSPSPWPAGLMPNGQLQ